jgi:hypothetical protein
MFSVAQKRQIAEVVQQVLRLTNHPELPDREIEFFLRVEGAEAWSWAEIRNNGAVPTPDVNPWNEAQAKVALPREAPRNSVCRHGHEHGTPEGARACGMEPERANLNKRDLPTIQPTRLDLGL